VVYETNPPTVNNVWIVTGAETGDATQSIKGGLIMLIDITPVHKDKNCHLDQLITVSNWLNLDYELMFADSWGFLYQPPDLLNPKILGERINAQETIRQLENCLYQYSGIGIELQEGKSSEEALKSFQYELSRGRPSLLVLDSFFCPWDELFNMGHINHTCIVVGFDSINSNLICTDGYYNKKNEILSLNNFMQAYKWVCKFIFDIPDPDKSYWGNIINNCCTRLNENFCFQQMNDFSYELENYYDILQEMKGFEKLWSVPMLLNFDYISRGRFRYSVSLQHTINKYAQQKYLPLVAELEQAGSKWSTVRSVLLKEYMTSRGKPIKYSILSNLASKVRDIAIFEKSIADRLWELYQQKDSGLTSANICSSIESNQDEIDYKKVFVDLSSIFNNKGFGSFSNQTYNADLTGLNQYFHLEGAPPAGLSEFGGMQFNFPEVAGKSMDNVSCMGQRIIVPNGIYKKIMFLGCADTGNFSDRITLEYEDGFTQMIPLEFSDWTMSPVFGETQVWKGNWILNKEEKMTKYIGVYLYAKKYTLNGQKNVTAIYLPSCPNLHIFSITLEY